MTETSHISPLSNDEFWFTWNLKNNTNYVKCRSYMLQWDLAYTTFCLSIDPKNDDLHAKQIKITTDIEQLKNEKATKLTNQETRDFLSELDTKIQTAIDENEKCKSDTENYKKRKEYLETDYATCRQSLDNLEQADLLRQSFWYLRKSLCKDICVILICFPCYLCA